MISKIYQIIKSFFSTIFTIFSINIYKSRIGWKRAKIYSDYQKACQRKINFTDIYSKNFIDKVEELEKIGFTSYSTQSSRSLARSIYKKLKNFEKKGKKIWDNQDHHSGHYLGNLWKDLPELKNFFKNDLEIFLKQYFRTNFRIYYGTLYKKTYSTDRLGSENWHSDSGPGICLNIMYYLEPVDEKNGAMELLPWNISRKIYFKEKISNFLTFLKKSHYFKKSDLVNFYDKIIDSKFRSNIVTLKGEEGLIIPFLNNTLHRGGHNKKNNSRIAIVFHCYPTYKNYDYEFYNQRGISKINPYPFDPYKEL